MPVVVRNFDDNQAVIAMVDSNLQREHLKLSEKAFAYKMKLEAIKRQGARTDLTFCQVGEKITSSQVGPKLDNSTLQTHSLTRDMMLTENGCCYKIKVLRMQLLEAISHWQCRPGKVKGRYRVILDLPI